MGELWARIAIRRHRPSPRRSPPPPGLPAGRPAPHLLTSRIRCVFSVPKDGRNGTSAPPLREIPIFVPKCTEFQENSAGSGAEEKYLLISNRYQPEACLVTVLGLPFALYRSVRTADRWIHRIVRKTSIRSGTGGRPVRDGRASHHGGSIPPLPFPPLRQVSSTAGEQPLYRSSFLPWKTGTKWSILPLRTRTRVLRAVRRRRPHLRPIGFLLSY